MISKQIHSKRFLHIALVMLLLIVTVIGGRGIIPAFADTSVSSNVLEDLQKDSSFTVSDYPDNLTDYTIKIIQIAEGKSGELYIYTYQPSQKAKYLVATDINMSLTESVNGTKHYGLKFINANGVFAKYLVTGFTVSKSEIRYYNITSIFRAWDSTIDAGTGNDNTINGISFEVGQLWTARTVNGAVKYEMSKTDVIEITDKYVGFIRYDNGFKLYKDSCDSHFIAFSTEHKIDNLMQADVSYVMRGCKVDYLFGKETGRTYSDYSYKDITLDYNDIGGNRADGWWADKVEYHRIESAKDFAVSENFDNQTEADLKKYQWVLRFAETDYTSTHNITAITSEIYSEVSKVTILRLKFETDGRTYNLGVVDNKQTGSETPIGQPEKTGFWAFIGECFAKTFTGSGTWWQIAIVVIVIVIAFVAVCLVVRLARFGIDSFRSKKQS